MKRIVYFVFFSFFLTFLGNAQNYAFEVTGTVISHTNGVPVPVPNQAVDIIVDSTGNSYYYQNTVFTDSAGFFNDYIYLPPEAGFAFITVSTFDQCLGYDQSITAVFAPGAQLPPFDFFLCDNNPPECMAIFYWDYIPMNSMTVQFFDDSYGAYTEWLWDFGDGATSTETNPVHTYSDDGLYQVCLTISDSAGDCYSTNCDWVQVGQNWWGCDNFFSYYFTDSVTTEFTGYVFDSVYQVLSYDWDFGDGTTGSGQMVSHTFTPMGNSMFIVCLTTTAIMDNGDTCTAVSCQDVFIGFPPPPSPCESYFFPLNQAGLTVDFEAFTFSPHPTDFSWDFGDNTLGTGQFVSHTYAQEGIYMVTLNTIDSTGCEYEYTMEVWVDTYPLYSAFGYVFLVNGVVADDATVRLMTTDSLWQNVVEVSSTTINDSGFYHFDSIPMNNYTLYFVQAELHEGSAWYGQYLPTYHISALTWQEAMPILPIFSWPLDIFMIEGTPVNSGAGMITGSVTLLGTRGTVEGIEIMLMNEDLEPYIYTRSDESGTFRFENLAFGNYMIYAEMMGIETTPAMITLSEGQPEATVEVQVAGGEANYLFGVAERLSILEEAGQVYPNPATGNAKIEFTSKKPATLRLDIYNQVGQRTWSAPVDLPAGTQQVSLPLAQLPAGFYYLNATSTEGDFVTRRIVKSK